MEDLLNKSAKEIASLLRQAEAEVEGLAKDVKNQRIMFSLGLMVFVVIAGAIIIEAIRDPNPFVLMLIGVPILILTGIYKQAKITLATYAKKIGAEEKVSRIKSALASGKV